MVLYNYRVFIGRNRRPVGAGRIRTKGLDDAIGSICEKHPVSKLHPSRYEHLRRIAVRKDRRLVAYYHGGPGERGGFWYKSESYKDNQ